VLILLRPLFLRLPLPLVLVSCTCATVDVKAVVEARKAAVPKSTQKDTAWCIQIFLRSNTTERATYLLQNLPGTVELHTAHRWLPLSLAILSSQLAVEVWRHQMGSSYFVLMLFSNNSPSATKNLTVHCTTTILSGEITGVRSEMAG